MLLFFCVFINAFIGVIFKLFGKYKVDNLSAIVVNYFTCVITGSFVYQSWVIPSNLLEVSWFPYAAILGFVFVAIFNVIAHTIQHFGIVISTIFQRMSLLAPATLGVLLFNEALTGNKIMAIILALGAIFLLSYQKNALEVHADSKWVWLLPLLTLLGSSIIDGSLFLVEAKGIAPNGDIQFTSTLFLMAGVGGLVLLIFRYFKTGEFMNMKSVIAGVCLGIPNFFSIYFILLLLAKGYEGSVVFPVLNVGILCFAAIFGFLFFKEKISNIKKLGFGLAIAAIVLLFYPFN
jgi:drug/metabolite transporter (DMT)-like permease